MYQVAFCLASASAASAGVGGTPDEVEDEEDGDGPESESPGSGGKVAEDILQSRKLRGLNICWQPEKIRRKICPPSPHLLVSSLGSPLQKQTELPPPREQGRVVRGTSSPSRISDSRRRRLFLRKPLSPPPRCNRRRHHVARHLRPLDSRLISPIHRPPPTRPDSAGRLQRQGGGGGGSS